MIELGSLIGFAVVFYCAAVGLSAVAGVVVMALRPRVAGHGARTEKHVAGFAIAAPVIVAFGATVALALYSLAGADHCLDHSHRLHLCLRHGGGFASRALLLAGLAGFVVYGLITVVTRVVRLFRAGRLTRKLARSATLVSLAGVDVFVTPSEKPFCFSAGLLGSRVFMSSAAWNALDNDERRAAIAHEAAHGRSRDLLARTLLDTCGLFGAPSVARRLILWWSAAAERACDAAAGEATGDASSLASAIVAMLRAGADPAVGFASFGAGDPLARVEILLAGVPANRASRGLLIVLFAAALLVIISAAVSADPVHHLAETILGAH